MPSRSLLTVTSLFTFATSVESQNLVITNGCSAEPMWIAHMGTGGDPQNLKLAPGMSHTFNTPSGLSSTRYWPKLGCDGDGNFCHVGASGGPGQLCSNDDLGCAPPVDTKFEATFGQQGEVCDPGHGKSKGCDWLDMSLVDGWTLPFKLDIEGTCPGAKTTTIDCSQVSLKECPRNEAIKGLGDVDLLVKNPHTKQVAGCYSPCGKLTFQSWKNPIAQAHTPNDALAAPYCCPTPPQSPEQCRKGPVGNTQFVQAVHKSCPGVYGYSYDDGVGLMTCTHGSIYRVTFYCDGSVAPSPGPAPAPPAPAPPAPAPPAPKHCNVGDAVTCPGHPEIGCAGSQCCPDGSTCPSADPKFNGCKKPKVQDCTIKSEADFLV